MNGTNPNYGFILHTNGNDKTYWKKIVSTSNNSDFDQYISVNYTIPTPELSVDSLKTYYNADGTGYFTLDWDKPSAGAKGYNVWIYNGNGYQSFNIDDGDITTFTTKGKKIWPSKSQVDAGRRTLYTDGVSGQEFPANPDYLYKATGGAYPTTKHYWFKISVIYADGIGQSDMSSNSLTPTIFEKPQAPIGKAYTNMVSEQSGYVNLNWSKNLDATGYKIYIYNGKSYEAYDAKNTDTWTTQNKGIWPIPEEIQGHTNVPLHHPVSSNDTHYGGTELPLDPSPLYRTYATSYPNNKNYWFRISQYDEHGESPYSATAYTPILGQPVPFLGFEDYWSYVDVYEGSVNTATGNLILSEQDFSLAGKGPGLSIERTYNSQSTIKGLFGIGWHSNLDKSLKIDGNNANYVDEDGTLLTFIKDTNGVYQPPTGVYSKLTETSTELQLKDSVQTVTTFDKVTGKIKSIEDGRQLKTTFSYTNNQLTKITDSSNRTVELTYNTDGYVQQLNLLSARTISFEYTNGILSKVIGTKGEETKYEYNEQKQLVKTLKPVINTARPTTIFTYQDDKVETVTDPLGKVYQLTYDTIARNVIVSFPNGEKNQYWFNEAANPTKIIEDIDDLNTTTIYQYEGNNLIESYDPNDVGKTPTSKYTYDNSGNTDFATSHYGTDEFDYDSQNNLTYYKDTESNVSTTVYNGLNPISENDVTNAMSSYTKFDAYGNAIESSFILAAATNLVTNSSFQNGLNGWTQGTSLNDSGNVSVVTDGKDGISGNQSIKLTSQSTSSSSGYLFAYQTISGIKESATYTLSAFNKTDLTDATAVMKVAFLNLNGATIGTSNSPVLGTGKHGWNKNQVTFKTPSGTTKIQIKLEVDHTSTTGTGSVYFDSVQLERAEVMSAYNPVENAGFENVVTSWTGTGGVSDSINKFDGEQSLKIVRTSSTAATNEYKQTIKIGQKTDDSPIDFTLTGVSKSSAVQANGTKDSSNYALKAVINYVDGTNTNITASFLDGTKEWNRAYKDFAATKPINTIDLSLVFGGNFTGTTWFDGIRIIQGKQKVNTVYDSNGNYVDEVINQNGYSIKFETDSFGNTKKITDSMGITKAYAYDNGDQLEKVTLANGTIIQYAYNLSGYQTSKTIQADGKNQTYQFEYDDSGDLLKTTGPLQDVTSNKYDVNGRLIETTFPSGNKVSYTYDGANHIKTIFYNQTEVYSYGYDSNGNETSSINKQTNRTTLRTFDEKNRVTKQTISNQSDGMANSVQTWNYPSNSDKLTSYTFTQGATTDTTSYTYNQLDQNTVTSNTGKQFVSQFDERDNLRSYVAGNNTSESYQYSNRNLIDSIFIQLENGTTVLDESYSYDPNGNRTKINLPNSEQITFTYDQLNQLTAEEYPDGTKKVYRYDGFGNRTSVSLTKNGTTTEINAVFNSANQLTSFGGETIQYDADGNRTSDGQYTYDWNIEGNLVSITKKGDSSPFITYKYDEQDRRIQKTVNGAVTKNVYAGDSIDVLYETDAGGTVLRSYVYSADGSRLTMKTQGQVFYYHYNGHGDVIALTDDTKKIVATYAYDAWGNVTSTTGSGSAIDNPFGYAGYMYDKEIKMYYLIARYYRPEQGVFLSLDSEPGDNDDAISQNGFNYANNNPIIYFDPDGNMNVVDGQKGTPMMAGGRPSGGGSSVKGNRTTQNTKPKNNSKMPKSSNKAANNKTSSSADRQAAVRAAWKQERELVRRTGKGTRPWTQKEKQELLKNGKVQGYEGHHVNSVKEHPGLARNPDNIRFVNGRAAHLKEHNGNFRDPTSGPLVRRNEY